MQQDNQSVKSTSDTPTLGFTTLTPEQERSFQEWYARQAQHARINSDPDAPKHHYDYRAAWQGLKGKPLFDETLHGPSTYKMLGHPNRFVWHEGRPIDTITMTPLADVRFRWRGQGVK